MAEAEPTTIARPYARAAFAFALEQQDGLAAWAKMLSLLATAVMTTEVQLLLDNPQTSNADKAKELATILGDELSTDGANFLVAVAEHGRLTLLPKMSQLFELLKAQHEKSMEVSLTSAFEVSEQEQQQLTKALQTRLQRDIHLETSVDKNLIGGLIIKAEDTVINDSVRGRLNKLSQALG
ncbi:MAG: F0F1 ATP synthase subunit delta [Pseudomonadales bacterium]